MYTKTRASNIKPQTATWNVYTLKALHNCGTRTRDPAIQRLLL
jgi:hypothetical protein